MRALVNVTIVVGIAVFIATWLAVESGAQAPEKTTLAGAWIRNADLSDQPARLGRDDDNNRRGERGGGFGRRGGMGRGGYGGGMGRGGYGGGGNPEEMARMREAMRDIMNPSDRLTIVQTDSIVMITGADGRTMRLSPDGKKIKDDNTKVERKTRWDNGKLVSEINGAGPGKIVQTFAVDPEQHQLRITVQVEGGRNNAARTITNVYEPDAR